MTCEKRCSEGLFSFFSSCCTLAPVSSAVELATARHTVFRLGGWGAGTLRVGELAMVCCKNKSHSLTTWLTKAQWRGLGTLAGGSAGAVARPSARSVA